MAEKISKLPQKKIKSDYDKYKETVNIDFEEDGKTYRVVLHPYFQPSRKSKLIKRLGEDLDKISKSKIEFPDELIPTYLMYQCLIEFSDFPITESKDIKKQVSYFTEVINTKYFKEVVDSFVVEEFTSVWEMVLEILAANEKVKRMAQKTQNDIKNLDIQSPELYEKIHGEKKKRIPEA